MATAQPWSRLDAGNDDEEEEEEEEDEDVAADDGESHSDDSEEEEAMASSDEDSDAKAQADASEHRISIQDDADVSALSSSAAFRDLWDDVDDADDPPRESPTVADHAIIDVLADELRQREIPSYLEQFEVVIPDSELVVGAVPVEEVQARERAIEEARIRQHQLDAELVRQREARFLQRERTLREELEDRAWRQRHALLQQKTQLAQALQLRTRRLAFVFQQAETHLRETLQRQQARVRQIFGQLEPSRVPAERKRYRVECDQIPVTLQVRARQLRALKDKVPSGQYVILVTLYDRLGGHALHWTAWDPEEEDGDRKKRKKKSLNTNEKKRPRDSAAARGRRSSLALTLAAAARAGNQPTTKLSAHTHRVDRPSVTRPFYHRGRFYNTDVRVDQNLFVVCPPQSLLRPGNVLVFELFLLQGTTPMSRETVGSAGVRDQIVAWGAMPLMTPDFQYIDGKYKLPLLRGEMDATMDKFRDIETMYTRDLSAWLCNLYIHVTPLRHEVERLILGSATRAGYDIEIDERNGLLRTAPAPRDELPALSPKSAALKTSATTARWRGRKATATATATNDDGGDACVAGGSSATMLLDDATVGAASGDAEEEKPKTPRQQGFQLPALLHWGSAKSPSKKKLSRVHAGSVVTPQLNDDETQEKPPPPQQQTKQEHQLVHSSSHKSATSWRSHRSVISSPSEYPLPSDHHGFLDRDRDNVEDPSGPIDMENYLFSVNPAFARETAHHQRFHAARKLRYLRHELFVDLGLTKVRTLEFWLLLVILALALWLRVYLHYVAQYLFLKAQRVPVFYFEPQWTTCVVKYTWRTIATHTEIGVIASGVLGNWGFFGGLALTAALAQEHVGELPPLGSKFIVCVGLATVLDPLLVLLVDLANRQFNCATRPLCDSLNWSTRACRCVEGDAFKLFMRFQSSEGSGLVGIALTAILYTALTCLSLLAFYMYLLHVHMNGRMLDVYRRIHAQETELFLPHDCEVGLQELKGICEQAARWRGPQGAQRKVFVHEYVLRDPLDAAFEEKSTHIAVYTIALDGSRELYRHFLKSHDGAIVELLGEVGAAADGSWHRNAAPGLASLALIHNILQDQQRQAATLDAAGSADVSRLFDAL